LAAALPRPTLSCFIALLTKRESALFLARGYKHRTPNGVRETLFLAGAINIALLTECARLYSSPGLKTSHS